MTTWENACDASYSMPDPEGLAKAGYTVVMGYLSHTPGKGMTAAYVAKCAAADVRILPLYETGSEMALGGKTAGIAAATTATAIARSLGCPADVDIIYALDHDYSTAQMAGPITEFIAGLHSVAGPDGEYGGYNQLAYLGAHKLDVGRLFQTYAWSAGRWLPSADAPIEQYHNGVHLAGGMVDLCRIDTSNLTLWEPGMPTVDQIVAALKPVIAAEIEAQVKPIADAVAAAIAADDIVTNPWQRADSPNHTPPGTNPTTKENFAHGDEWQRVCNLQDAVAAIGAKVGAIMPARKGE